MKSICKIAIIGVIGLFSLNGKSVQQEVFPDLQNKYFLALEHKDKMYQYYRKDFSGDGQIDHIRVYYDLNSNGEPDCMATFHIGPLGYPSKYAEMVCYSKTEDGNFQEIFADIDGDGKLETKLKKEELDQINKYKLMKA